MSLNRGGVMKAKIKYQQKKQKVNISSSCLHYQIPAQHLLPFKNPPTLT